MSTILHLKKRRSSSKDFLIPGEERRRFAATPKEESSRLKEELWQALIDVPKKNEIHDREWLELICNWIPRGKETPNGREIGALPFTEQARWIEMALRVSKLDENKTGKFTLSTSQSDLIFKRLTDPRFELIGLDIAWVGFTKEFFEAYGRWPDGHNTEDDFDAEFEEDQA